MTIRRFALLALSLLVSIGSVEAATRTWTGAASALWSNPANWQEGIVPAAGDALVFPAGGAQYPNNDLPVTTYQSLTVANATSFLGNAIGIGSGGITVDPAVHQVLLFVTVIAAVPQTWNCHAYVSCDFNDAVIDATVTLDVAQDSFIDLRGTGTLIHQSGNATVRTSGAWTGTVVQQGARVLDVDNWDAPGAEVEMNVPCTWTGCPSTVTLNNARIGAVNIDAGLLRVFGLGAPTLDTLYLGPGSAMDLVYNPNTPSTLLHVGNPVSVAGVPLSLGPSRGRTLFRTPGSIFTLIDYTGAGPIGGTFAGLPQGATLRSRSGQRFQVSYTGGDGNDVTLTTLEHYSGGNDFDGNGHSDVLWRHAVTGENYRWTVTGPAHTGGHTINTVADLNWKIATTADFDGDGDSDMLWRHAVTGENYMYLMQGGAIQSASPIGIVATTWQVLGTGDFDGDGRGDVFWRDSSTGQTYVYFMNGMTIAHAGAHHAMATNYKFAGAGDLNADGMDDILWHDASTGEVRVWIVDHLNLTGQAPLTYLPSGWFVAGVGQFSSRRSWSGITDHRADLILRSEQTGEYSVHTMKGGYWETSSYNLYGYFFGGTVDPVWKIAAIADYNRDGVSDIFWRHSVTGETYVYLVTTDTSSSGPYFSAYALTTVPDLNWQIVP